MSVEPGYSTGNCSPELYESISCEFAAQRYARFVQRRYGIGTCLEDTLDKMTIKKRLLDLNMIYDEDMCVIKCCEPGCVIRVVIRPFIFSDCTTPSNPSAVIVVPEYFCEAVEDVEAVITYQN
jgi:hypothetical protein